MPHFRVAEVNYRVAEVNSLVAEVNSIVAEVNSIVAKVNYRVAEVNYRVAEANSRVVIAIYGVTGAKYYFPMSLRYCIPCQFILSTAEYASVSAESRSLPVAVTPSTRPPDVR